MTDVFRWRRRTWVYATASLVAASAVCATPAAGGVETAARGLKHVALGDSAAAAPLVPDAADPPGCFKSTNDYPAVLARRIGAADFVDFSCSGTTAADITERRQSTSGGEVPRQIDAITADTALITITIGRNDVGLASSAAQCRRNSLAQPPCFADFVPGGNDRFSTAIRSQMPLWEAMIGAVRAKAPRARIVLVGYGTYIRPGGCFGRQPINPQDADYFQAKVDEIDDQQRMLAGKSKVDFFDTRPVSTGHDMCAAPDDRYIEGFELSHLAAPLHPNALGAGAVGSALAGQLDLSDVPARSS